ncbi:MAG: hypothetical protein K2L13_02380, partial [Opitutales bacterium]|nr:hypothetical protein [Opitutales bacterium]
IICIATYSLRFAGNAQAFLDIVNRELGISVNIIPGEKEAQLITDSVRAIEQVDKFFTFDIGGGSIEFSVVDNKLVDSISKNIGIINLATLLKKQSHSSDIHMSNMLDDVRDIVSSNLSELRERHDLSQYPLICTGGSLVIANEILKVGNVLKYEIIFDFFEKIHPMTYSERIQFGIPPGKIDVFDVALAVTLAVMDISGKRVITVSRAGVRHGAAINHHLFL